MRLDELVKAQGDKIRQSAYENGAKAVRFFGKIEWDSTMPDGSIFVLAELDTDCSLMHHARLSLSMKEILGENVEVFSQAAVPEEILKQLISGGVPLTHDDNYNLAAIQTAIEKAERYKALGREMFEQNELVQTFVVHQLQIVHVLSSRISDEMKEEADDIDWQDLVPLDEIPLYKGRVLVSDVEDGREKDLMLINTMIFALELVERQVEKPAEDFASDELLLAWAVHHLTVAGDAAKSLSLELRQFATEIPWDIVIEMANILEMAACDLDWREVWNTVVHDVRPMITYLQTIKATI